VQHYLARRFAELREPATSHGRTIGLLDHLSDAEYDGAIRRLVAPQGRGNSLDMLEIGPEVERKVLEHLRSLKETWRNVNSVGDLALALFQGGEAPVQAVVDELARDLAGACEALLAGFAADTSALQQFNQDVNEKRVRLDCLRIYSGCYLRMARSGDQQELDVPAIKRLGVANSKGAAAEAFRRELEAGAGNNIVGLQPFDLGDDALVVYQEKAGIPLCYYQELETLSQHYYRSRRQRETHIDWRALHGRLPDIRRVSQERQKHLAHCLELTLYGIITGVLTYRPEPRPSCFWLESRGALGGPMPTPVGEQFEAVVNRLAEQEGDRAEVQVQLDEWFRRMAGRNEGQQLVLLWCALQDLCELVRSRVAARVARAGLAGQREERNSPMFRVLAERMVPAALRRVQGLPGAAVWLSSGLDLSVILRDVEGDEREKALRLRRELLAGCLQPAHEGLPIPVISPGARVEEKVFGDLLARRSAPLPRPAPADGEPGTLVPPGTGETQRFRFPEDYDQQS